MGAFSRSNRQLPSRSQATRKGPVRLHSAPRWPAPARALRASAPPRHSRPRAPVEFRYRNRLWTGRPHRWGRNIPCSHATTCRPCRRSAGRRSWRSTRAATWQSGTGRCRHRTHVETAVLADGGGRRVIEIRRALRWQLHRDSAAQRTGDAHPLHARAHRGGGRVEPQSESASGGSSAWTPHAGSTSATRIQRPCLKPLNSTVAGELRGSFRAICLCWRAKRATSPATGFLFWESTGIRNPPARQLDGVAINA